MSVDRHQGRSMMLATKRPSRKDQAIAVRDAALFIMRTAGRSEPHGDGNTYLIFKNADFDMMLRTPFQRMPALDGDFVRKAMVHGIPLPKLLGYGLDVWRHGQGKVLNVEWGTDGTARVASFKRGSWEQEIFQLVECLPHKAEAASIL
jgi:hypothetical protein